MTLTRHTDEKAGILSGTTSCARVCPCGDADWSGSMVPRGLPTPNLAPVGPMPGRRHAAPLNHIRRRRICCGLGRAPPPPPPSPLPARRNACPARCARAEFRQTATFCANVRLRRGSNSVRWAPLSASAAAGAAPPACAGGCGFRRGTAFPGESAGGAAVPPHASWTVCLDTAGAAASAAALYSAWAAEPTPGGGMPRR